MRGYGAGAGGICGGDQVGRLQVLQYCVAGGQRDGMRIVGEAVEEGARAVGDGVDYFFAGDDGAQGSVSAGESFGGY